MRYAINGTSSDGSLLAVIVTTRGYASETVLWALLRFGFRIRELECRPGVLEAIETCRPHLVILAIRPNEGDERRLISLVARVTAAPVLVLAPGLRQVGFVEAMRDGADACLSESDGAEWLSLQIQAILRRGNVAEMPSTGHTLVSGPLSLDLQRCTVTLHGRVVSLTPMEFRICATLMQRAGTVMSPAQILASVNEEPYTAQQARDAVKVYIGKIRRKLQQAGATAEYIKTVRGFGYLVEPVSPDDDEIEEHSVA